MPRPNKKPPVYLEEDELQKLLSVIKKTDNARDYALYLVAYNHGLRASEIGLLEVDHINFKTSHIKIQRLKGSNSGEYLMRPEVAKALKKHLRQRPSKSPWLFLSNRGDPISRITLDKSIKKYGEIAGLPPNKRFFHILKHSIASHLYRAGTDALTIQDWLGWVNIRMVNSYTHISSPTRDSNARKFFIKLPKL